MNEADYQEVLNHINLVCKYNSFLIQIKIILIVLDENHQLQFYMLNEMCLFESQITLLTVHFEW